MLPGKLSENIQKMSTTRTRSTSHGVMVLCDVYYYYIGALL